MNEWDIVNGIDYQNGTIIAAAIIRPRSPINNTLSPPPLFSNHDIYNSLPFPDGYIFPPVFRSITYFKYTRIDCNYFELLLESKKRLPGGSLPQFEADITHPPLSSPLVKGVAREEVLEIFKVVATRVKASFRTCARSITSATSTTPPWLPRSTFIERSRVGYAPSDVTGTRGRDGIPGEGRDCQRWMCSGRGRRGESGDSSDSSCATPGFRVDSGVKKIKGRMMIPPTPLKTCNSPVQPRNPICSILSREYLVNGGDNDYILSLSFLLLCRFHFYTSISPFITRR